MSIEEHLQHLKQIDADCQANPYAVAHMVKTEDIKWAVAEIERMREALNTIYWTLPATNPQAGIMKGFAKKGLYGE